MDLHEFADPDHQLTLHFKVIVDTVFTLHHLKHS